jgi:integrase
LLGELGLSAMPRIVKRPPEYRVCRSLNRGRARHQGKTYWFPGEAKSPESWRAYAAFLARFRAGQPLGAVPEPEETAQEPAERAQKPASPPPQVLTIAELIERYWNHCLVYYRGPAGLTGEHRNIRCALRPLLDLFGDILANEFEPSHLKIVRDDMIRRGWSRKYINKAIGKIKHLFKWGVGEKHVTAQVFGALAVLKGLEPYRSEARETAEVEAVSDDVIEATLRELAPDTADMIRVARLCACRPSEIVNINGEETDRRDPDCWWYRPKRHKNAHRGHKRSIPINREAQTILLPYIVAAGSGKLFRLKHRDGLRQAVERACARAFPHPVISAIPKRKRTPQQRAELLAWNKAHRWHPNQIRHAALQEAREKDGADGAQALGGHKHIETTEHYTSVTEARAKQAAAKLTPARATG